MESGRSKQGNKKEFRQEDDIIIDNLKPVVKGIGKILGRYCEVVLHSLKDFDHSVVAIENAEVTGRKVGSPMTDLALGVLNKLDEVEGDIIGTYNSQTKKGESLKSLTIVVRNLKGNPIGFICININLSTPLELFMKDLLAIKDPTPKQRVIEHYPLTTEDLLEKSYKEVVHIVNTYKKLNPTERVKKIVKELYKRGIFNVKNGIDYVAEHVGVSRYTVYNYIRDIKTKLK